MLLVAPSRFPGQRADTVRVVFQSTTRLSHHTVWRRQIAQALLITRLESSSPIWPQDVGRHLFLGCAVHTGGGWSGALLIADGDGLEQNIASEVHVECFCIPGSSSHPNSMKHMCVPMCRQVSQPRGTFLASTSSPSTSSADTLHATPRTVWREATEDKNDFWSVSMISLTVSTLHFAASCVFPKESSFLITLKYTDVNWQTKTIRDSVEENSIDDQWNVDTNKTLSQSWVGSTRFQIPQNRAPKGHT